MNSIWSKLLNSIIGMPGAKINREEFLLKTFSHLPAEKTIQCLSASPAAVIPQAEIEKAAASVINSHTAKVAAVSAISGIPGGLAMLATIPADLANYYYHVVMAGQKLGYLYGFPDMIDSNGKLTQDGEIMLTAFIGVMNKVEMANELIRKIASEVAKRMSEETARRIAGNILSKQIISQAVEAISTKLGAKITAKSAGRGLSKAIPLVSGIISGSLTYTTFKRQAKRLHETLKENLTSGEKESLKLPTTSETS